jgi:hypothetical protein
MKADGTIWEKICQLLGDPEVLINSTRFYINSMRQEAKMNLALNDRIQKELDDLTMERQWVITQARKGRLNDDDLDYQLASIKIQELTLKQEMAHAIEITHLVNLDDWESKTREYLNDLRAGLEWLNAVPNNDEERHQQFELKRRVVKTLVEKVMINKEREMRVVFRLDLKMLLAEGASYRGEVGTYTHTRSCRGHRRPDAGAG